LKIQLGDIVRLKKAHACGEDRWEVLRTGADFRIRCLGCRRMVMLPRSRIERNLREIQRVGSEADWTRDA
jgi:hypothetical protein